MTVPSKSVSVETSNFPITKLPDAGIPDGVEFFKGKIPVSEPVCWETDIKVVEDITAEPIDVHINDTTKAKIDALMKAYPHMEWLAYLVGEETDDGRFITDIVIPEQEVTVVRVDVIGDVGVRTIGVIHSHHDMGNSFSHTDDEFINQNNPLSLCVSHGGINGVVRIDNGDGNFTLVEANVVLNDFGVDIDEFLKDAKDVITVKTYTNTNNTVVNGNVLPVFNNYSAVTLTQSISNYRNLVIFNKNPDDVDYIEIAHLKIILGQFLIDDTVDEYVTNIDMFYSDENFATFSNESVDLIDNIEGKFSNDLSATEKKDLETLQKLFNTILLSMDANIKVA